ncbi:ArsO family NAD(P)H-dependent flavin-containing monooxygenase [Micromonospora andamanensis]|uniref:flavin-containing monooxygenase n=1 Tax=Micromonospora andamanensis TaxID=1287068 RepID=UPI001951EA96|nr:NAD(P)/FAD-dependent oxidoreductase [Micromonospora andamanensis]GIJ42364.1 monooxygenase [Micromonospora andamanensis]
MSGRFGAVIIGGGQAGLAAGQYLRRLGAGFVVLDAGEEVGWTWRRRWDSLRLFTPARFNHLPGLRFPARPDHYPSKDEMADYLVEYANRFALPVRHDRRVRELKRDGTRFTIHADGGDLEADHVVVATGPTMIPHRPSYAGRLDVPQLHSSDYRNPDQLPDGQILVVGAGNSGAEIALDLAPTRRVVLAGADTGRLPVPLGGLRYRLLNRLLTVDNAIGRRIAYRSTGRGSPLVRTRPEDLATAGVVRVARVIDADGGRALLADGRKVDVAAVVWCTGYRPDYHWIRIPVFNDGRPVQHRGVVAGCPGLYFVGLPFQSGFASSLVGGVGRDARYVTDHLAARRTAVGRPTAPPGPWDADVT